MCAIHYHQLEHRSLAYSWSHGPHPHPLIVIHGLGDSSIHTYVPRFAATVLENTSSLFIDLPGFGEGSASAAYSSTIEAMADDVANLLSALDITNAPMFAHSMGANVAISLCNRYPTIIRNLILAEPLLQPNRSVLAAGIAKYSEDSFVTAGHEVLVRATSIQARRGDAAAESFLATVTSANPMAMHRAAVSLLRVRKPAFNTLLLELPHAVTLLLGERTRTIESLMEPGRTKTIRVPNAGHFMMTEAATETAYAILEAVNGMHYGGN